MLDSLIFIQNNMMYHYNIIDIDYYLRTLNSQMIFDQEYEKKEKNMEVQVLLFFTEKNMNKIQKKTLMCKGN